MTTRTVDVPMSPFAQRALAREESYAQRAEMARATIELAMLSDSDETCEGLIRTLLNERGLTTVSRDTGLSIETLKSFKREKLTETDVKTLTRLGWKSDLKYDLRGRRL